MPTLGLVNIGALVTGVLASPRAEIESVLAQDGRIAALGAGARTVAARADVVIDCRGTTVIPGLIDSHCHVVLGDYTPRQKTVDFLDSYVHGGITSVVSAGEGVHAPGRPHDPVASKALAMCWSRGSATRTSPRWPATACVTPSTASAATPIRATASRKCAGPSSTASA